MSYLKLQASRAIKVVPDDTIAIPDPATKKVDSTTTAANSAAADLIDSGATFESDVNIGDIVYNVTDGAVHTVATIVDDTHLTFDAGSIGNNKAYRIYRESTRGCVVYVGGTGDLEVVTAAGDTEIFSALPVGYILPVNVTQVKSTNTTATLLTALW